MTAEKFRQQRDEYKEALRKSEKDLAEQLAEERAENEKLHEDLRIALAEVGGPGRDEEDRENEGMIG